MKARFGTARVDWREPPALWVTVGWLAAVMWPPLPVTWILWPATQGAGALLDWRVIAGVMGGAGVAATFALIERERRQHGQPRSRFGVMVRFIAIGFLFSIACALILALSGAIWTAVFASGDIVRRLAEFKASLIVGLAFTPAALIVGVSYSLWAGIVAAIITFTPRAPSVRPQPMMMDQPPETRSPVAQPVEPATFAPGSAAARKAAPAPNPSDFPSAEGSRTEPAPTPFAEVAAAASPLEALFEPAENEAYGGRVPETQVGAVTDAAPEPAPEPRPEPEVSAAPPIPAHPPGRHPETELEAALRPDWLEHGWLEHD